MPKKKKTATSGELVMVKSVHRTRSRRMKSCVYGGLGIPSTSSAGSRMAIQGHCLPLSRRNKINGRSHLAPAIIFLDLAVQ